MREVHELEAAEEPEAAATTVVLAPHADVPSRHGTHSHGGSKEHRTGHVTSSREPPRLGWS